MPEYEIEMPIRVRVTAPTAVRAWDMAIAKAELCPGHFIPEHDKPYSPARIRETLESRRARNEEGRESEK